MMDEKEPTWWEIPWKLPFCRLQYFKWCYIGEPLPICSYYDKFAWPV